MIYFFRCEQYIKIGYSTDVASRLNHCRVGNPFPVEIVATAFGDAALELDLQTALRRLRHRNEWFREEGDLSDLLADIITMSPKDAGGWIVGWLKRGSRR